MDTARTCSRPGCEKKLRSNNTTGQCATGCRSPEAPPAVRASGTSSTSPRRAPQPTTTPSEEGAVVRFRTVCAALGIDPDAELETFAEAWLEGLKAKLTDGEG